jgi:hypothetical protein
MSATSCYGRQSLKTTGAGSLVFSSQVHRPLLLLAVIALTACSRGNSNNDSEVVGELQDDDPAACKATTDCSACKAGTDCGAVVLDDPVDVKSTEQPGEPFSKFEVDGLLYTSNVYDGRAHLQGGDNQLFYSDNTQDFVRWNIPVASALGEDANACDVAQGNDSVTLQYRITSRNNTDDRYDFVRAFPAMVLGTMGGRYESAGVECDRATELTDDYQRDGDSPVYDMEQVRSETGFPMFAGDLSGPVNISVSADLTAGTAGNGLANVFLDSYWHDVSTISKLPGQDPQWQDTVNGINADYTEVWNLNIWFDWPYDEQARTVRQWTGGISLGTVQLPDNPTFEIFLKAEGPRSGFFPTCELGGDKNCFLYIALVLTDRTLVQSGVTVNYTEIANWMKSEAFRDLFLDGIALQGSDDPAGIAYEIWRTIDGPENDTHPDAAKRGPAFPNDGHLIGGLHLGSELWFNESGQPAEIVFDALGVEISGIGTYGLYRDYPLP